MEFLEWLKQGYAYAATVPFLVFVPVFVAAYLFHFNRKKAITLAVDITAPFLIGAVAGLADMLFPNPVGSVWIIILFYVLAFGLLGNAQQRKYGRIDWRRLTRAVWRLGFLLMACLYIVFMAASLFAVALTA